jgi:hypothetical protein
MTPDADSASSPDAGSFLTAQHSQQTASRQPVMITLGAGRLSRFQPHKATGLASRTSNTICRRGIHRGLVGVGIDQHQPIIVDLAVAHDDGVARFLALADCQELDLTSWCAPISLPPI